MELRKSIKRPARFSDDTDFYTRSPSSSGRFKMNPLLRPAIIPFNPNLPPAAFPTLPFPAPTVAVAHDKQPGAREDNSSLLPEAANTDTEPSQFHRTGIVQTSRLAPDRGELDLNAEELARARDGEIIDYNAFSILTADYHFEREMDESDEEGPAEMKPAETKTLSQKEETPRPPTWDDLSAVHQLSIIDGLVERAGEPVATALNQTFSYLRLDPQQRQKIVALYLEREAGRIDENERISKWQNAVHTLLMDPTRRAKATAHNFHIGAERHLYGKLAESNQGVSTSGELSTARAYLAHLGLDDELLGSWTSSATEISHERAHLEDVDLIDIQGITGPVDRLLGPRNFSGTTRVGDFLHAVKQSKMTPTPAQSSGPVTTAERPTVSPQTQGQTLSFAPSPTPAVKVSCFQGARSPSNQNARHSDINLSSPPPNQEVLTSLVNGAGIVTMKTIHPDSLQETRGLTAQGDSIKGTRSLMEPPPAPVGAKPPRCVSQPGSTQSHRPIQDGTVSSLHHGSPMNPRHSDHTCNTASSSNVPGSTDHPRLRLKLSGNRAASLTGRSSSFGAPAGEKSPAPTLSTAGSPSPIGGRARKRHTSVSTVGGESMASSLSVDADSPAASVKARQGRKKKVHWEP